MDTAQGLPGAAQLALAVPDDPGREPDPSVVLSYGLGSTRPRSCCAAGLVNTDYISTAGAASANATRLGVDVADRIGATT
jgi:hypothetical protein